jgi:hypothetical protein
MDKVWIAISGWWSHYWLDVVVVFVLAILLDAFLSWKSNKKGQWIGSAVVGLIGLVYLLVRLGVFPKPHFGPWEKSSLVLLGLVIAVGWRILRPQSWNCEVIGDKKPQKHWYGIISWLGTMFSILVGIFLPILGIIGCIISWFIGTAFVVPLRQLWVLTIFKKPVYVFGKRIKMPLPDEEEPSDEDEEEPSDEDEEEPSDEEPLLGEEEPREYENDPRAVIQNDSKLVRLKKWFLGVVGIRPDDEECEDAPRALQNGLNLTWLLPSWLVGIVSITPLEFEREVLVDKTPPIPTMAEPQKTSEGKSVPGRLKMAGGVVASVQAQVTFWTIKNPRRFLELSDDERADLGKLVFQQVTASIALAFRSMTIEGVLKKRFFKDLNNRGKIFKRTRRILLAKTGVWLEQVQGLDVNPDPAFEEDLNKINRLGVELEQTRLQKGINHEKSLAEAELIMAKMEALATSWDVSREMAVRLATELIRADKPGQTVILGNGLSDLSQVFGKSGGGKTIA